MLLSKRFDTISSADGVDASILISIGRFIEPMRSYFSVNIEPT